MTVTIIDSPVSEWGDLAMTCLVVVQVAEHTAFSCYEETLDTDLMVISSDYYKFEDALNRMLRLCQNKVVVLNKGRSAQPTQARNFTYQELVEHINSIKPRS